MAEPEDTETAPEEDDGRTAPRLVDAGDPDIGAALAGGAVIALPSVGGYCLAAQIGPSGAEERLAALAADPEGPHYVVGQVDDVRALTSGWSDEVGRLLERCWPGPVEVFLPRATGDGEAEVAPGQPYDQGDAGSGGWAVTVGMPDGRALRKLCREHGPWRMVPLSFTDADEVAHAFDAADVPLVVDGGRREGEPPTVVDATVSPVRVLREGALPANFIDASLAMGTRRRWFSRGRKGDG